jgi:hypothetical protein
MKLKKVVLLSVLPLALACCTSRQQPSDQPAVADNTQKASDSPAVIDTPSAVEIADTMIKPDSAVKAEDARSVVQDDIGKVSYTGEQAIIYRTKKDYSKYVPVTMNADKTRIVSYPSPKDIYYKDKLALPEKLNDGFLLDNRGIHPNSVFLKLTYEEYSKLDQAPLLSDMLAMIEDKDPVIEIYSLGTRSRFKEEKNEINALIERGALKKFKKIK